MSTAKSTLMIGVSGVRGVIGETLTPEVVTRLCMAFGTYLNGGRVVLGRDTRTSGLMIKHSVIGALLSAGCEVMDLDVATTPTCALMVEELKAAGGVIITGSHNPVQWNALKFLKSNGVFLNDEEGKQMLNVYYQNAFRTAAWDGLGLVNNDYNGIEFHIKKVLDIVDVELIRSKRFKVVLDSCNGAGAVITPSLLSELGCDVECINCEPNGNFAHNPEPTIVNLKELCAKVKSTNSDIGFAQDPDADRLALIDHTGHYIGEEYSVCLTSDYILRKNPGKTAVVNMSTTIAMEDICRKYKSKLIRTKVGEVHVAEAMLKENGIIGGEGNGGVMYPLVHPGRDSLIGIGLILQYMAESGKSIRALSAEIPKYFIVKDKINLTKNNGFKIMERLKGEAGKFKLETIDGISLSAHEVKVNIRPSNTEPIIRIFAESKSEAKSKKLVADYKKRVKSLMNI